jgi:AraC-like DNA-binding protein
MNEHSSPVDNAWEHVRRLPQPRLRGIVHDYQGFRYALARPRLRRELPHDAVTLFFALCEPIELLIEGQRPGTGLLRSSLVAGLQTEAQLGGHQGAMHGMEVTLTPWGAFTLLGLDMSGLARTHATLADLPGPDWGRLTDSLSEIPGWPARFDLLDRFLLRRLDRGPAWDPRAVLAWEAMVASGGTVDVPGLAEETGWRPRQMVAVFRDQLGLTPKAAARVVRLQRVMRELLDGTPQARAAVLCGFYDQPHLALEFRRMVGCTPAEFVALRSAGAAVPALDRRHGQVTSLLVTALDGAPEDAGTALVT